MESPNTTNSANGASPTPQIVNQIFLGPQTNNQVGDGNSATVQRVADVPKATKADPPQTNEAIKRERDIKQLKRILSQLHRGNTNAFLYEATSGYVLYSFAFHYWEGFIHTLDDANFHLYDKRADRLLREFAEPVQRMLAASVKFMHLTSSGEKATFDEHPGNLASSEYHRAVKQFPKLSRDARFTYEWLYTYLRENYLEIDFDETDAIAATNYREHQEYWDKIFSRQASKEA